uniref:Uncharacterized protein n=1 Tax=Romanomermis culicivorax TaxID=13658 RepID=A0A915LAW3_ROMCU
MQIFIREITILLTRYYLISVDFDNIAFIIILILIAPVGSVQQTSGPRYMYGYDDHTIQSSINIISTGNFIPQLNATSKLLGRTGSMNANLDCETCTLKELCASKILKMGVTVKGTGSRVSNTGKNASSKKSGTKTETSSSTTKKLIDPKESATKAVKSAEPPEKTNDLEFMTYRQVIDEANGNLKYYEMKFYETYRALNLEVLQNEQKYGIGLDD